MTIEAAHDERVPSPCTFPSSTLSPRMMSGGVRDSLSGQTSRGLDLSFEATFNHSSQVRLASMTYAFLKCGSGRVSWHNRREWKRSATDTTGSVMGAGSWNARLLKCFKAARLRSSSAWAGPTSPGLASGMAQETGS